MAGPPPESMRRRVLRDHRRVGTRFIPPFLQFTSELHETSWPVVPLPELLWIGLLHASLGFEFGSRVAIDLSRTAIEVRPNTPQLEHFVAASSFNRLSDAERIAVREAAAGRGFLCPLVEALRDLHTLYPESPLRFLQQAGPPETIPNGTTLERFKSVLRPLLFRYDAAATRVAGAAIGVELETARMSVTRDATTILGWRKLSEYPDTDESKRVGGTCRAAVNMIFTDDLYDSSASWPAYFWDRGLELERCYFALDDDA